MLRGIPRQGLEFAPVPDYPDQRVGADTIIVVRVARAVSVLIAEEYIRGCPHYVAGAFAGAAE